MTIAFERLRTELLSLPTGVIEDASAIESLLASCWPDLTGNADGGMESSKLSRMESVVWEQPLLRFVIERHGGTVNGSKYAELQHWSVNIETHEATLDINPHSKRLLHKLDKRLDVRPLADAVGQSIIERVDDPFLKWEGDDKVKVLISAIFPATNQQTTSARRKRFWKALEDRVRLHGWSRRSSSQFLSKTI